MKISLIAGAIGYVVMSVCIYLRHSDNKKLLSFMNKYLIGMIFSSLTFFNAAHFIIYPYNIFLCAFSMTLMLWLLVVGDKEYKKLKINPKKS